MTPKVELAPLDDDPKTERLDQLITYILGTDVLSNRTNVRLRSRHLGKTRFPSIDRSQLPQRNQTYFP
jgi:hypothetical protein